MKRRFNIITYFVYILVAIYTFSSCTKGEESISSQLILNSENNITFGSQEKGKQTIHFETSRDWTASSNTQWCKISPASGKKGVNTITVSVLENDTYDQRKASITIIVENYSTVINVSQEQNDAILPAQDSYKLNAQLQTLEFKTSSNVDYTITTSVQWLNHSKATTKGLTEKTLKFDIEENFSFSERIGTIILKSEDITKEISVIQECYPKRMRIELLHSDTEMEYPTLSNEGSAGMAIWGDGTWNRFSNMAGKTYKFSSSNEKNTIFDLYETDWVVIPAINSAKSITFYCD